MFKKGSAGGRGMKNTVSMALLFLSAILMFFINDFHWRITTDSALEIEASKVLGGKPVFSEVEIQQEIAKLPDKKEKLIPRRFSNPEDQLVANTVINARNVEIDRENRNRALEILYRPWESKLYDQKRAIELRIRGWITLANSLAGLILVISGIYWLKNGVFPFLSNVYSIVVHRFERKGSASTLSNSFTNLLNQKKIDSAQKEMTQAKQLLADGLITEAQFEDQKAKIRQRIQQIKSN
jgi:hypothetical protein